jgi:hypothetical protein
MKRSDVLEWTLVILITVPLTLAALVFFVGPYLLLAWKVLFPG